MSCNVDLLHIGIWTFYSGATLLLASLISFRNLDPIEKANMLEERNENKIKVLKQTSTTIDPSQLPSLRRKKTWNYLV